MSCQGGGGGGAGGGRPPTKTTVTTTKTTRRSPSMNSVSSSTRTTSTPYNPENTATLYATPVCPTTCGGGSSDDSSMRTTTTTIQVPGRTTTSHTSAAPGLGLKKKVYRPIKTSVNIQPPSQPTPGLPRRSGATTPAAGGLRPPSGGLRPPSGGLRPPSGGLRTPSAGGLRPPSASLLKPPGQGQGLRTPSSATGSRGSSNVSIAAPQQRGPSPSQMARPSPSQMPRPSPQQMPPPPPSSQQSRQQLHGIRVPQGLKTPQMGGLRAPGGRTPRAPSSGPSPSVMQPPPSTPRAGPPRVAASTGAVPKTTRTTISTTSMETAKKKTVKTYKQVKETDIGRYVIPMQVKPGDMNAHMMMYSSPPTLRQKMQTEKTGLQGIKTHSYRDYKPLLQKKGFMLEQSGVIGPGLHRGEHMSPVRETFLDENVEPEPGSPHKVPTLEEEVEEKLLEESARSPKMQLKATGTRSRIASPTQVMTKRGPVEAETEVTVSKTIIRSPGQPEIVGRQLIGVQLLSPGRALRTELEVQTLDPGTRDKSPVQVREVIHVTSNVAIAEDVKQTTKTVTYDTVEREQEEEEEPPPDPVEVEMLIEEENADIENTKGLLVPDLKVIRPATYGIRKQVSIAQLNPETVSLLEQAINYPSPNPDEEQEEPQPETIANMMNTEEKGLTMDSAPSNMYNYLFAEVKIDPTVEVSSAAPAPMIDIVVPVSLPDQIQEKANDPEVLQASIAAEQGGAEQPKDSVYVDTVGKEPVKTKNTARKGKRKKKSEVPVLAQELPPWAIQDLDPVVDLVGGPPAGTMLGTRACTIILDPAEDGIEYMLHMEPPRHSSRVQLRGSQKPCWFPGYILALPEIPETMMLVKSPSVVFGAAWKATQPDIFDDNSLFIV